jgi:hypothetical protein
MLVGLAGTPRRERSAFVRASRKSRNVEELTLLLVVILAQASVPVGGVVEGVVPALITSTLFGSRVTWGRMPLLKAGTVVKFVVKVRFEAIPSGLKKSPDSVTETGFGFTISITVEYFVNPPSKLPTAICGMILVIAGLI